MKFKKLKFLLLFIVVIIVAIGGLLVYLYQQGGVKNYVPPVSKADSPRTQVLSDLSTLSQTIEAYYAINLKYPDKLDELQPDFITKLPLEPVTGKNYVYETDGISMYRIVVSNPKIFDFKELALENGKIIKQ